MLQPAIIITCEHGGHSVPSRYRALFAGADSVLLSHRGWDPGALTLARRFAGRLKTPLHFSTVTRLLVELNRSLGHPRLFSEFTSGITFEEKTYILERYWHQYRHAVQTRIQHLAKQHTPVFHLSVHSFTPVWDGNRRTTDIGLLYDPRRPGERELCRIWQQTLRSADPGLTVHRNAPYRGASDGFVTALRKQFHPDQYVGVELEVNQRFLSPRSAAASPLSQKLLHSFQFALSNLKLNC